MLKKLLTWTALTVVVSILLLGFGLTWPVEVLVFLGTGWFLFLARVLPEVHLNGPALVEAVVVAGVLAGGLHLFLSWLWLRWHEATPDARPWPGRWSVSLVALLVLLFGAAMATVGLAHHVGWMVTSREPLVRSSWFVSAALLEQETDPLCEAAWRLSVRDVPDAQLVQALMREPDMPPLLEQLALVPSRDATGAKAFLVFPRDLARREHTGGLRCRNRADVEPLPARELSRLLEAVQAGDGGASASPM